MTVSIPCWKRSAAAAVAVLCAAAAAAAEKELSIERILGPEVSVRYKHPASIAELKNGDLYIAYYGGDGEYAPDTAVYGLRRRRGETAWSMPRVIADTPWRSEGNAVVWQAPSGLVWLFYVNRYGETWSTSRILAKISRDGAETWSDSFHLTFELGSMVRGQPIVLESGEYLLPAYHETGHDTEFTAPDTCSYFLRYDPRTNIWSESNRIRSRIGNLQAAAVELEKDHLVAYCRRGGGFEGKEDGYIVRSESRDGGRTWSPGADTAFPNPNSAVDLIKLRNGHLLLVYNDSKVDRTPLTAAISTDGERSFPHRRNIAAGPNDLAYPFAIQIQSGRILVVFTAEERTVIRLASFDEEWVLQGGAR